MDGNARFPRRLQPRWPRSRLCCYNFPMLTGLPSQAHSRGMLAEAMDLVRSMMNSEEQTTSSLRRTNSEHIPEESQQAHEPPSALFVFM
jgi:hypothetical protein